MTKAPPNPAWALASAGIGTLSHVIIDVFTHTFNPIFWPYTQHNVNWMLFGDRIESSLLFIIPFAVIILAMLALFWTKKAQ